MVAIVATEPATEATSSHHCVLGQADEEVEEALDGVSERQGPKDGAQSCHGVRDRCRNVAQERDEGEDDDGDDREHAQDERAGQRRGRFRLDQPRACIRTANGARVAATMSPTIRDATVVPSRRPIARSATPRRDRDQDPPTDSRRDGQASWERAAAIAS